MANLENLNDGDLVSLQQHFENQIKPDNPNATLETYKVDEKGKILSRLDAIEGKIDTLAGTLKRIFGGYSLINGQWVDVNEVNKG